MMWPFKNKSGVVRNKISKPTYRFHWQGFIKPAIVLLCAILGLLVYSHWAEWLEKLDRTPIKSYALTHKTRFTTNEDIREILSRHPAQRGYFLNNKEKTPQWEWGGWGYTAIQSALSLQAPLKGYFSQDIQELQNRFLEVSWIKDVVVRKLYPDRLGITLIEYQPAARWNNNQYLSEQGVIFELPEGRFQADQLPVLFGPDSEGKTVLDAWNKIKQDLTLRKLVLYSVAMDNRGAWTITLDNGVELRLGRGDWLPKIDRFVAIFPQIEVPPEKRLAYVDLRYEHGAAVGFINK